jgi:hypothetical protein
LTRNSGQAFFWEQILWRQWSSLKRYWGVKIHWERDLDSMFLPPTVPKPGSMFELLEIRLVLLRIWDSLESHASENISFLNRSKKLLPPHELVAHTFKICFFTKNQTMYINKYWIFCWHLNIIRIRKCWNIGYITDIITKGYVVIFF